MKKDIKQTLQEFKDINKKLAKFRLKTMLSEDEDMVTYKGKDGKSHKVAKKSALSYDKKHPA